ncbi:MAG: nucleotidyl transferase AbiEii/AbiGii toxin family protein [bacterium]
MLTRYIHETNLRRILSIIYSESELQNSLLFKGGTALLMFYDLDRFSTDLDFNCISEELNTKLLTELFADYEIQDYSAKYNTWFWLLSYQKNQMKIKIEISKRDYKDEYEVKELLGVKMKVMVKECMFAHKLCAITDRKKLQNRDLYDAYFMFKNNFDIKEEIIEFRMNMSLRNYLKELLIFIEKKVKPKNILDGMGELFTEKQKIWVKNNLIDMLKFEIRNKLTVSNKYTKYLRFYIYSIAKLKTNRIKHFIEAKDYLGTVDTFGAVNLDKVSLEDIQNFAENSVINNFLDFHRKTFLKNIDADLNEIASIKDDFSRLGIKDQESAKNSEIRLQWSRLKTIEEIWIKVKSVLNE